MTNYALHPLRRITNPLLLANLFSFALADGPDDTAFVIPTGQLSYTSSASIASLSFSLSIPTDHPQTNLGASLSSAATAGVALGVSLAGVTLCLFVGCILARIRHRQLARGWRVVKVERLGLCTSLEGGSGNGKEVAVM
jgi:hypothetical protein